MPSRDRGPRLVVQRRHDGAQPWVQPLDPLDRPLDELGGRHLAAADERGLRGRVQCRDLRGRAGHGDLLGRLPRTRRRTGADSSGMHDDLATTLKCSPGARATRRRGRAPDGRCRLAAATRRHHRGPANSQRTRPTQPPRRRHVSSRGVRGCRVGRANAPHPTCHCPALIRPARGEAGRRCSDRPGRPRAPRYPVGSVGHCCLRRPARLPARLPRPPDLRRRRRALRRSRCF